MRLAKTDIILLVIISAYVLTSWAAAYIYGLQDRFYPLFYMRTGVQFGGALLLFYFFWRCLRAFWIMAKVRPPKLTSYLWNDLKQGPLQKQRFIQAVPVFIGMVFFFSAFSSMKMLIPQFQPYIWDEFFADIDQAIHFGMAPWKLLHPVIGYAPVTFVISFIYILWLGILFLVLYWQLFSLKNPQLRARFFISFVLSWAILGTFFAIIFSSAGPCFYEGITGEDRFTPLMDYLRSVHDVLPVWALETQNMLWDDYQAQKNVLGGGISAFPSIHVATAFLFMLLGWQTNKVIGWLTTIFFVFILIGSFHLGWHYAVDGYFSILVTWVVWRISKYITDSIAT